MLLQFVILSLYTDIAPRRNQDYMFMNMIKKLPKDAPTDKNYYEVDKQQFIFNKYKTAKSYGQTILPVPEELQKTLALYIKHHPNKTKLKEGTPLLVKYDGTQLNTTNGITRILNKIFGKNVGSSMLRHSYLTTKYADNLKEMKEDQVGMGHSASVQASYIKLAEEPKNEVVEPAVNYVI
jgi:integrase